MLDEGVSHELEVRKLRSGIHGRQSTNLDPMKEYQAVIQRLTRHTREDEDALTDLFNERSRSGWEPVMMAQDEQRLTIVFQRETEPEVER